MSTTVSMEPGSSLRDVRVDRLGGSREKHRRHTDGQNYTIAKGVTPKVSSISNNFVYENTAYEGSLTSINDRRVSVVQEPPTSVIREQYWTCSKWPNSQRVLAITVGVLLGAIVGLTVFIYLLYDKTDSDALGGVFGGILSHAAPD